MVNNGLPSGVISYQLSDLEAGNHTCDSGLGMCLTMPPRKRFRLSSSPGMKPELYDVFTDANPARDQVNFYVTHNRPDATLNITIDVFDLLGRRVWTATQSGRSGSTTSFPIAWDLVGTSGARVPRGIYVYRATVSTDGVLQVSKSRRIAVTAQ